MQKIIAIGESVFDTVYDENNRPVSSFVGGRVANAAALLGSDGLQVTMVSECCSDHAGDVVVDFLESHGVNTRSVDRYVDGATAISLIFNAKGGVSRMNYSSYPHERFDVVWPRFDENDVLLFGSFYSIEETVRPRLFEMVNYALERKAIAVYLPGCQHGINCRITKVMPAILENFEAADVVIANRADIEAIYPGENGEMAYKNHIEFYDVRFFYIDDDLSVHVFTRGCHKHIAAPKPYAGDMLGWQSRFVAGVVKGIVTQGIAKKAIHTVNEAKWAEIVADALARANEA
ncbi:MAG: carbohydrate kinase family protein [Muribaculaceae bacterium]